MMFRLSNQNLVCSLFIGVNHREHEFQQGKVWFGILPSEKVEFKAQAVHHSSFESVEAASDVVYRASDG